MKKNDPIEINPPALAIMLAKYGAESAPDFATMPSDELQKYLKEGGVQITAKDRQRFAAIIEEVEAKIRLEKARAKLTEEARPSSFFESLKEKIALLPTSEIRRILREQLSVPGTSPEVYARDLEKTSEDDLRTLLFDLEREKQSGETAEYDKGTGNSV